MTNIVRAYDGQGKLTFEIPYKDGLIDGTMIRCHHCHRTETEYIKGVMNGTQKRYDSSDGKIIFKEFFVNGKESGKSITYNENGSPGQIREYVHGTIKNYDKNGNVTSTEFFLYDGEVSKDKYLEYTLSQKGAKHDQSI